MYTKDTFIPGNWLSMYERDCLNIYKPRWISFADNSIDGE